MILSFLSAAAAVVKHVVVPIVIGVCAYEVGTTLVRAGSHFVNRYRANRDYGYGIGRSLTRSARETAAWAFDDALAAANHRLVQGVSFY
jgi:hypothetical protein